METLDRMPWAAKNSVFRRLAEIGEVSNMSKDEREKYDSALRHYRDTLVVMQALQIKDVRKDVRKPTVLLLVILKSWGCLLQRSPRLQD